MGGKDSPTPCLVSDSVHQQERMSSPSFSPLKRKDSICSSGSSASTCSISSSGHLSSVGRTPSIRYVPRSKSSINLEMRRKFSDVVSPVPEPRRGRGSSTLNREGSFHQQQHRERSYASLPRSSASSCTEGSAPVSLKCVLVGDSAVGKTSLLQTYTSDKFTTTHNPTIYDKFSSKYSIDNIAVIFVFVHLIACRYIYYDKKSLLQYFSLFPFCAASLTVFGQRVNMTLCDTSGSDDFGHLRPLCYPQADVVLVLFSVTDYSSFENARGRWLKEVKRHCPSIPVLLIGTQVDKRDNGTLLRDFRSSNKKYVTRSEGTKAAASMKAVSYIECSAKAKTNVKSAFDEAIATALEMNHSSKSKESCSIL